jgi:hypothetical protein
MDGSGTWDATNAAATTWFGGPWATTPVVGDWNGAGKSEIGVYSNGTWYRDIDGTGIWDATDAAAMSTFGVGGLMPALGNGAPRPIFPAGGPAPVPVVGVWSAYLLPAEGPADAGTLAAAEDSPALTQSQLQPIVTAAIARWSQAGLSPQLVHELSQVQFVITNLSGALGQEADNTIFLDRNADGYGWFVDPTPQQDAEFAPTAIASQERAVNAQAVDRIDLLTVVEHELGHVVGLGDVDPSLGDVMSATLGTGVRRTPQSSDVDAIFAFTNTWK